MFHVKRTQKILIISGPTASGKSGLATRIAREVDSVIINADSIQLYKELPILSSQPSKIELQEGDHRLYSTINYQERFSVNHWLELATKEINNALKENKLPIVVGGTGLYLSKLIDGINKIEEVDEENKQYCSDVFDRLGADGLIEELIRLGDEKVKVAPLDKHRLMRRLGVLKQTGKTLSHWHSFPLKKFYAPESFIHVNLNPDREALYLKCNERFALMIKNDAMKEAGNFLKLNPKDNLPIMKTIGLSEIKDYMDQRIDEGALIEQASQKTRHYAKRQLTWFRNQFKDKIEIKNVSRETVKLILDLL
jgi:tRNA dimethylallyltransferase